MSEFSCPRCETEIDTRDIYSDYLVDLGSSSTFTYECKCGCSFKVHVDWEPIFYVLLDSVEDGLGEVE